MNRLRLTVSITLLAALAACNAGKDSVLFATRTITALDLDTTPAAFDLGYARQEVTIAPTFEKDQTLPVMTTVGGSTKGLDLTSDHSFGTGDAVLVIADALLSKERYYFKGESEAERRGPRVPVPGTKDEDLNHWSGVIFTKIAPDDRRPFFFGTDTSLGVHLEFTSGVVPTSGSVGFKRKELACVPLIEESVLINGVQHSRVQVASLLAIASVKFGSGGINDSGTRTGQAYATGPAATLLATHPEVRMAIAPALVGDATVQARAELNTAALFSSDMGVSALWFLGSVYDVIVSAAEQGDLDAAALRGKLDAFGAEREVFVFQEYQWSTGDPRFSRAEVPDARDNFRDWSAHMSTLQSSIHDLKLALANGTSTEKFDDDGNEIVIDIKPTDGANWQEYKDELDGLEKQLTKYRTLYKDAAVLIEAKAYFDELLAQ